MNPRGPIPSAQADLDDQVFDLHCSADAQVDNTGDMLVVFAEIYRDGRLDDFDDRSVRVLLARTKVEHRLNREQLEGMGCLRRLLNPIFELVTAIRGENQRLRQQAVRG
ncbi:MAG: hypothetical protein JXA87_00935 [Thermoleophilia bacterium]|nr:hypothetical protein [Thermoleophilia bacterium]